MRGRSLRRGRRLLLAATVGVLALAAPASAATSLSTGHLDALDVDYESGVLSLDLKLYSPAVDDANPADYGLVVLPASQVTVPTNPAYSFLGPPGSTVWILPQAQNAALLWPGWNTEGVPTGQLAGNSVSLRLTGLSGPGDLVVYTVQTGVPTVRFNSTDGLPDALTVAAGAHAHGNWAFTAAGTYTATFEATATTTGGAARTSGPVSYTFTVG